MSGRLCKTKMELLQILICSEPTILSKVQSWNGDNENARKVVVMENGSMDIYFSNGFLWWQRLCGAYRNVSIIDIAVNIADAIAGSKGARNKFAFDEITRDVLEEAVVNRNLNCVVDILVDIMRICSDGEFRSEYINERNIKLFAKENGHTKTDCTLDVLNGYIGVELRPGVVKPMGIRITRKLKNNIELDII